ncbi:MAG TPA: nucleotide exchange factor GrpE [Candidatus Aphodovivens avistercoris]|nr:nucleotide exchange factor GrpE [Candidatus Aphodovivens avistercoris]
MNAREWLGREEAGRGGRPFGSMPSEMAGAHGWGRQTVRCVGGYAEAEPLQERRAAPWDERLRAAEERAVRTAQRLERMMGEILAASRALDGLDALERKVDGVAGAVERLAADDAAAQAAGKLDELLLAARALGDSMAAHAAADAQRVQAADEARDGLSRLSERFEARIAKTDYEEAVLKQMSDEVQQHRDGLYRRIVEPLVSEVVEVYDGMGATLARHRVQALCGAADAEPLLRDMESCRQMIGDLLRNWGVEEWRPSPGDALEPLRCRAVRAVPTDDPALHRTVAETISAGYAFDGKVLRPAQVAVCSLVAKPTAAAPAADAADAADAAPERMVDAADAANSPEADAPRTDAADGTGERADPAGTAVPEAATGSEAEAAADVPDAEGAAAPSADAPAPSITKRAEEAVPDDGPSAAASAFEPEPVEPAAPAASTADLAPDEPAFHPAPAPRRPVPPVPPAPPAPCRQGR